MAAVDHNRIACSKWVDCGITGGGCCSIGEYERPSFGVCLQICTAYDGPPRIEALIAKALKTVKDSGCCGGTVKRVKWWGIEWVGVPKPVRWWRWALTHGHPRSGTDIMWPGCGCIGYLYDLRKSWRVWLTQRYWKRRRLTRKMGD